MTSTTNSIKVNTSDDSHVDENINNTEWTRHNNLRYDWSEETQGLILSSYYWGFIILCPFSGFICQKFGANHSLGMGVLFLSILTLLTPSCIYWGGSTALIMSRAALGFVHGIMHPAAIHLLAHWIPQDERSMAGSLVFNGAPIGTIFGTFMSGIILQYSERGWPMVFYFFCSVGLVFFLLNTAFCYGRPSENPYISDEELTYLSNTVDTQHENLPATPWRYILKSPSVWALIIAKLGYSCGLVTITSDMPKYRNSVLKFSTQETAYFTSASYLAKMMCALFGSWIADKAIAEKLTSITAVRKIGCTIGHFGPAIFIVLATYVESDNFSVIALQSIGVGLMGCTYFITLINTLDLSPIYASAIMGVANGIAVTGGGISPYIVGMLIPNQTISEWRLVFWIVAVIFVISNVIFIIYVSGEIQKWNDPDFFTVKENATKDVKNINELLPLNET